MYKKTMTYKTFDDVEITEDFYFNLTKAELTEWEFSESGGLRARLQKIIDSKDLPQIIGIFKEIIMKSYGVKSPDGRKFIKNKEVLDDFMQTNAYSDLYMELATDEKIAAEFVNSVVPRE